MPEEGVPLRDYLDRRLCDLDRRLTERHCSLEQQIAAIRKVTDGAFARDEFERLHAEVVGKIDSADRRLVTIEAAQQSAWSLHGRMIAVLAIALSILSTGVSVYSGLTRRTDIVNVNPPSVPAP